MVESFTLLFDNSGCDESMRQICIHARRTDSVNQVNPSHPPLTRYLPVNYGAII